MRTARWAGILFATMMGFGFPFESLGFDHLHSRFAALLNTHVKDGWVDYPTLKADKTNLTAYLDELAAVKESEFQKWSEAQQLAFLYNVYNATTLQLICDHYPVTSIKKIGGLLKGPWSLEVVRVWGKIITLDELEHGIIRRRYHEPRGHFALVCAARSCPPLRSKPYVADQLSEQLDDQGRTFLLQREKNRVDAANRTLYLSPIFKWFAEDFRLKSPTVQAFVQPYLPPADVGTARLSEFSIRYTDYDWSLNDSARRNAK